MAAPSVALILAQMNAMYGLGSSELAVTAVEKLFRNGNARDRKVLVAVARELSAMSKSKFVTRTGVVRVKVKFGAEVAGRLRRAAAKLEHYGFHVDASIVNEVQLELGCHCIDEETHQCSIGCATLGLTIHTAVRPDKGAGLLLDYHERDPALRALLMQDFYCIRSGQMAAVTACAFENILHSGWVN